MGKALKIRKPVQHGVVKVPVVMQMEALECVAASLTMILAYYGKWIPLVQVRADCVVSRDGSNARNILKAARSYGLTAKGYRYEPESLKESGRFPCIIHWNFNHFVVLNGFKKNKAVLNDPAKGTYTVPMETFDKSFTGICLMFEPGESFEPGGKPKSVIEFAKSRLRRTGSAVAFVVLTTIISSLIGIIRPAFSRIFIDRLLTGQNPEWLYPFVIALALLAAIELLVSFISRCESPHGRQDGFLRKHILPVEGASASHGILLPAHCGRYPTAAGHQCFSLRHAGKYLCLRLPSGPALLQRPCLQLTVYF